MTAIGRIVAALAFAVPGWALGAEGAAGAPAESVRAAEPPSKIVPQTSVKKATDPVVASGAADEARPTEPAPTGVPPPLPGSAPPGPQTAAPVPSEPPVAAAQPPPVTPQAIQPQPSPQPPVVPPAGQWVYTSQYGWVWMPYAQAYTHVPAEGDPYMYVYYPAFGWRWVVAPWIFGFGPQPYWGVPGRAYFSWHSYPWFPRGGHRAVPAPGHRPGGHSGHRR